MRAAPRTRLPASRRGGFTLVELVVVIFIIVVLVSLVAAAVFRVVGSSQENATQTTLQKLDTGLRQQWKAVVDQAEEEFRAKNCPGGQFGGQFYGDQYGNVMAVAGQDPTTAQKIWVALRLTQEFPATYYEALYPVKFPANNPVVYLGPKSSYKVLPQGGSAFYQAPPPFPPVGPSPAPKPAGPEEASACLLVALSQARRGMTFNLEEAVGPGPIGTAGPITLPTPPGGTATVKDLLDAWQNPLGFSRGNSTASVPSLLNLQPEIASAGRDGKWGTGDDISSVRLRTSGQRGD